MGSILYRRPRSRRPDGDTIYMIDTGSVAWVLASTALVLLMTPALGLFYGGMVRKKNFISVLMLVFASLMIVILQWFLLGYSLVFGTDMLVIGGLEHLGLNGVEFGTTLGLQIPDLLFAAFQMTFAGLTLAIIVSGVAERVKFGAFLLFGVLWTTFVYDPIAHWLWGGGWLQQLGALDFAGGTVVHISAGFGALALAIYIGKRSGFGSYNFHPQNIPLTFFAGGVLLFGWMGFNGGSALAANGLAIHAIMVTLISAAAGTISWMIANWRHGKPSSLGFISGTIAGLGAITPAAGFVNMWAALLIGTVAGILCYYALIWRVKKGFDESLDAWSIHGVGGFWGTIACGIFATAAVGGASGLIEGNAYLLGIQILDACVTAAFAFGATYFLAWVVDKTVGLRVSEDEEYIGLDLTLHGEMVR